MYTKCIQVTISATKMKYSVNWYNVEQSKSDAILITMNLFYAYKN